MAVKDDALIRLIFLLGVGARLVFLLGVGDEVNVIMCVEAGIVFAAMTRHSGCCYIRPSGTAWALGKQATDNKHRRCKRSKRGCRAGGGEGRKAGAVLEPL